MSKGKWFILGTVVLLAVVAVFALAACGDEAEEPAAEETALTGSAAERAAAILGREPTGLAKEIVDRGTVIVANDANYAPQSSIDDPASSTRTMSPYLSPKKAIAPSASASSLVVSKILVGELANVSPLASRSISAI